MGTLGEGIISGDWMSRIIKLESEVNNWRIKFEIESLWRKVVEEWIFDEFGFDVSRQTQKLEKNFRKTNIIDVTFSTKNVEVNFGKLKEALTKQSSTDQAEGKQKQNNNDSNNEVSAPQLTLKSLPSSISVTEVKPVALDYKQSVESSVEVEPHGEVEQILNISQNPGETINPSEKDHHQEIELIDPEKEPSYEFPTVPTEEDGDSDDIIEIDVDAADRTDFPLTIYDLEEDEDETIACADRDEDDVDADITKFSPIQPSIEESQSYDDSVFYQAEGLEFTAVEGTEDANDHEDQDFENCMDEQNLNNDVSIEEAEEDYPDELEFDPNNLVAIAHDTSSDTKKRPYRARPARSLIQTIVIPGEKRKFQCLACQRIFSDRGNGHRHVRRMHPGQSVHAQKQLGFSVGELTSQFGSGDNDPPLPVLIPEVSLGESPNRSQQANTSFSDTSFPDLTRISKGEDNMSSPGRGHLGVNVQLPLGIDIQAVDDPDEDEYEGLPVEDEDDDDDNNEFEDEEEAFLLRDNSQSAIPMSVLRRGEFGDEECNLQGRLSMEQRREAAKLIRKVNDQFKCIQCSRYFSVSCNARRHARVVHFGERLYECKICQKRFSSKTDGVIHEKFCMDKQGNLVTTLNQRENFPTAVASSSQTSVKVVARPRPSIATGVRDKAHLPIRRLRRACGRNGKNVSVPPNVLSTGLISKKVNGKTFYFECKVCRNRYADLRSAWSHAKRMHLTEKPHKCTHCPKSYFNRKDFLKHQLKCGPVDTNEEERDYAERMESGLNFSHRIPVDPGSLSGQAPDRDLDSPDLGHFLEISEVNEDLNDDDEVANPS